MTRPWESERRSPTIAEFQPLYERDDNEWWRLSSGDMQNLYDEATDRIEELLAALEEKKGLR